MTLLAYTWMWPPWWGWLLVVVLVLLGGCLVTAFTGPNDVAVGVSPDDRLLVRPVGLMRFFVFSNGVDVPVTSIVDVGVHDRRGLVRGLRLPGSYFPGIITAGTFRSRGEKDLWMATRAKRVLVIELHDERYRHVIVQVEDPEAATEALRAAMHRER